ncbi:MAG TPA: GNAT family N-acetyltransferase [Anaerolineales bacterium]|nr:GNAT family N-acetyltransferase [Anaerolineales bacterium]
MHDNAQTLFSTNRLTIRLATPEDADFFFQLWTDPRVMANVGFPQGIPISRSEIQTQIEKSGVSPFEHLLIIELKSTGQAIGEGYMSPPNPENIASTDVKLLPDFWGNKYGLEAKQGLLDYLFTHTPCEEVEATPNKGNLASIKMQEAVGGICIGEKLFEFPEAMQSYTSPVHSYIYRVKRDTWQQQQGESHA